MPPVIGCIELSAAKRAREAIPKGGAERIATYCPAAGLNVSENGCRPFQKSA